MTQSLKPKVQGRKPLVLSPFGSERRTSREPIRIDPRHRWTVDRPAKRLIVVERLEIGIAAREGAIFGVERNRTLEMRDGFRVLAALRVRDGEHVERVVVVGILVAHQAEMGYRLVVASAVDGERRRIQP